MGIIPVFDPTTGASGGPADITAGGADFSNLPYQTLDINTNWTLLTKSGTSWNAATYDANGVGSYTFNGSVPTTFPNVPVAYRQAFAVNADGDNVLLTTADNFRLDIRQSSYLDSSGVESILRHTIGFGICNDPTATVGSTFGLCALQVVKNIFPTYRAELGGPYAAATYSSNDARSHSGSVWVRDGKLIAVTGVALDGSGGFDAAGNRFANTSTTGYTLTAGPVYIAFTLHAFGVSGTYSGEATNIKVEYRCVKYEDITP